MPATKLIYGVGRVPKASEFVLGEIVVNVDDSKVYSKNKQNKVFEIGGNNTTIIEGGTPTVSATNSGFTTASVGSDLYTSADTSILKFRGGTGINITTGTTGNEIFITATGDTEVTNAINADTASYVEIANTASYVNTSNIDGNLFQFSSDGDQGGVIFSENNINIYSDVNAYVAGLSETDNVIFNNITSSADISASGDIFAQRLRLPSGVDTSVGGIIFDDQAGNSGFIYDDGSSMHLGYNDVDIVTVSSSNDIKLLVNGGLRVASGRLKVEGNITASSPVPGQGNISASGLLYASASQPTTHAGSIVAVVYDTGSGRFYYTGSYGAGGGTDLSTGDANRVLFYDTSGNSDTDDNLQFTNTATPGINQGYRELKVGVGANGRIRTETGYFATAVTSSIYRHSGAPIEINSNYSRIAFGGNKIDFRTFGEGFDYRGPRMSLRNLE
jgi:hypothetical protein